LNHGSAKKSHGKTPKPQTKVKRVRQPQTTNFKSEAWYQHAQQAIGVSAVRASQSA
jgi:hypothetical protein